jgi:hypothetical protein
MRRRRVVQWRRHRRVRPPPSKVLQGRSAAAPAAGAGAGRDLARELGEAPYARDEEERRVALAAAVAAAWRGAVLESEQRQLIELHDRHAAPAPRHHRRSAARSPRGAARSSEAAGRADAPHFDHQRAEGVDAAIELPCVRGDALPRFCLDAFEQMRERPVGRQLAPAALDGKVLRLEGRVHEGRGLRPARPRLG